MAYFSKLLRVELAAQIALAACAVLVALATLLAAMAGGGLQSLRVVDLVLLPGFALATYLFGVLPVVLMGAPIYAYFELRGRASMANAVTVGVWPGIALLLLSVLPHAGWADVTPTFAMTFIVCGLAVALMTHFLRKRGWRWVRAA